MRLRSFWSIELATLVLDWYSRARGLLFYIESDFENVI